MIKPVKLKVTFGSGILEGPEAVDHMTIGGTTVKDMPFGLIDSDDTVLEKEPLERASMQGELMAYRHKGFWQCMDTKRDRDVLEELWRTSAPWDK